MATDALHKRPVGEEEFHRRILQPTAAAVREGQYKVLPRTGHYQPAENQSDSDDSEVDIDVTGTHRFHEIDLR